MPMQARSGPVLLLPVPRQWFATRKPRSHGSDVPRRSLSVAAWFLSIWVQIIVVAVLLKPVGSLPIMPSLPEPIEMPLDQLLQDAAPSVAAPRARLGIERERPTARAPRTPELEQALAKLEQSAVPAEVIAPPPSALRPAMPEVSALAPEPPKIVQNTPELQPSDMLRAPEVDLAASREWADASPVAPIPAQRLEVPKPSRLPPVLATLPARLEVQREAKPAAQAPEAPPVAPQKGPVLSQLAPSVVPPRPTMRPTPERPRIAVEALAAPAVQSETKIESKIEAIEASVLPERPRLEIVKPSAKAPDAPRVQTTPVRPSAIAAPARPEQPNLEVAPRQIELLDQSLANAAAVRSEMQAPNLTLDANIETEADVPAQAEAGAPVDPLDDAGFGPVSGPISGPISGPVSGRESGPVLGPARSSTDLLSGLSDAARAEVDDGAGRSDSRSAFRQYSDPFADELPNRLQGVQFRDPVGFKEVLSFLMSMIGSGGITVRGGTVTPGTDLNPRQRAFATDAVSVLIDSWLDMHHGDISAACAAEMPERVRALLCPKSP